MRKQPKERLFPIVAEGSVCGCGFSWLAEQVYRLEPATPLKEKVHPHTGKHHQQK